MSNKPSVGFLGMGYYVPEKVLTNFDLEKMVDTSNDWIVERTGIRERHIAAPEQATSDLALIAAQRALEDAGVAAEELDLIVVGTESPDMKFPSVACILQDKLHATHAAAFDLAAGCSGFVYACGIASQTIASGLYKKVLVVGAETLSRILNWEDRNTCIIFGDGAGAAVLGQVEDGYGILSVDLGANGAGGDFLNMPAGGSRKPASYETVANKEHSIHMVGSEVFKFAVKVMGHSTLKALEKAGMTKGDIDLLVPHQANVRIIASAAKRLHLPEEKIMVDLDKYANTSGASIPIALCEARDQGRIHKGDNVVMVGFGAGLTYGSLVVKWQKDEEAKG
ncbi:ketoacyl-ACP synthase III [Acidaminococcus sp. NSJ-142]|jgi:3-oxoacyl-[acyl-carrier-protein] synthase-3|uniref:beta-ketoacyl-ACP synthase III n=1 Tax=Acidaminococcus TaxID=904 RepID=UPI000CF9ED63|nr:MULTISPECIES: beta-ketoacyl-ACP synthase III [Acidaminococcus]MCD2436283.1 ketoacyl-ACP synthase III [Acidaminococcus hominis]MCH4095207.1 ketoacyl-ACP synthase III [Acidaminococcus provencensis]RHK03487.1 ketoacyl-ACP synthase III [Acidaminococcus sp. AM05-11]